MRQRSLDDFLNPAQRSAQLKQQLHFRSTLTPQQRRRSKKARTPEETYLLMKAIQHDVERLEQEGVIEKTGRKWKYNI